MRTDCLRLALLLIMAAVPAHGSPRCQFQVEDRGGTSYARLVDTATGRVWADGPYRVSIRCATGATLEGLRDLTRKPNHNGLVISGFAGQTGRLKVSIRFELPSGKDFVEEQVTFENQGPDTLEIQDIAIGFQRALDAGATNFRWVAVPFRRQADGQLHDYSSEDLRARKFRNSDWSNDPAARDERPCDLGKLRSEAWIWTDATAGILVAKYNDDAVEYSVASVEGSEAEARLCYGGAGLAVMREPRAATRLAAGQKFTFGRTRYTIFDGGWERGYELYRDLLNKHGHRAPSNYSPPLNWNELFDVGWYHSDRAQLKQHYTRNALLAEAAKAREVGCDLLYLDPGWEICEGTTLWDEERLGKVADFSAELKKRFGLRLGYRTIGRAYRDEFSNNWYLRRSGTEGRYLRPSQSGGGSVEPVPLIAPDRRRNLALLPEARAAASAVIPGYPGKHEIAHLNDGWYNNSASWISAADPSWVEIDLGSEHEINEIALGSEHTASYRDRAITRLDVSVSTDPTAPSNHWTTVLSHRGKPLEDTTHFQFAPVRARRVRLTIGESQNGTARIDELEIYEAAPGSGPPPVRRAAPKSSVDDNPIGFWEVCTQNPEWQREKLKRILAVTGGSVDFMMFDEFDWRGPCWDERHGHAVPSTPEGHVRAVYGLVEAMHRKYPHVLVEAHDPVWPWGTRYLPVYFRQGFKSHRYQENWGFEFMWNPIDDLRSGRALCLYYYNLGCDIPLYDHITMEADNDRCLSFWWYASTVRHLGIGGKKGLNSPRENLARFDAYKQAVAQYNRLRPYFARGKFVGLDETAHLHVLGKGAILNLFNLSDQSLRREVRIPIRLLPGTRPAHTHVSGASAKVFEDALVITADLPPLSPALVELNVAKDKP